MSESGLGARSAERTATAPGEGTGLRWTRHLEAGVREQVARILGSWELFRDDEIEVALELVHEHASDPDDDYRAVAAFLPTGDLAGFALYGATPCTVGTWDLYWIAVRADLRGHGIGRELLERAEREMRRAGARLCVIETSGRPAYAATRAFYRACGYRAAESIPDFYEPGDDRITYVKRLDTERFHPDRPDDG